MAASTVDADLMLTDDRSAVARHAFVRDAAGTLLRVWCTRLLGLRAHAMVLSSASDNASAPDPQECTSSIVLLAPCVGP